ncbi:Uncharacterised protein [Serratia fonticola]|jgi:hypothetical protein|uniref:Uncharacterized protein n=1 Tax=Serratia fonticola TaxID=47917 RepID=A0A4U9WKA8_SERFO|nr:Uncharacterised protein [Serratia fonticola]CAI1775615.1 Uncharacterised protein [Serratia fonticola]CAI2002318.1 Uncharacterised protein [Serratia fonticola]CAI2537968.1 Uncharacterised protein [Serratia fonticola]VTR59914.1 Uncharacterised protein [Serratia fonticola]
MKLPSQLIFQDRIALTETEFVQMVIGAVSSMRLRS